MTKLKKAELPNAPVELPFIVRADLTGYRRRFGVIRVLVLVCLIVFGFLAFGIEGALIGLVTAAAILAVGFVGVRTRRIIFTGPSIEYRNWYGRTAVLDRGDIEGVIVFTNFYDSSFGKVPRVSIARLNSKASITLSGLYWPTDLLLRGVSAMNDSGISVKQCDDRLNFVGVRKRFAKHSTFLERNFVKIGLATAFVAVVVPVIIALVHDAIA